jgi:hypothetical protein
MEEAGISELKSGWVGGKFDFRRIYEGIKDETLGLDATQVIEFVDFVERGALNTSG